MRKFEDIKRKTGKCTICVYSMLTRVDTLYAVECLHTEDSLGMHMDTQVNRRGIGASLYWVPLMRKLMLHAPTQLESGSSKRHTLIRI